MQRSRRAMQGGNTDLHKFWRGDRRTGRVGAGTCAGNVDGFRGGEVEEEITGNMKVGVM